MVMHGIQNLREEVKQKHLLQTGFVKIHTDAMASHDDAKW